MMVPTEPEDNETMKRSALMSAKADLDTGVIRVELYLNKITQLAETVGNAMTSRLLSTELLAISKAALVAAEKAAAEKAGEEGTK